jgi:hypothetical protein
MTEPIKDCGINFPSNSGRPDAHTWPCANTELIEQLRTQIAEITEKRDECATVLAAMTERSTELIAQHRQLIGRLERAERVIGAARRFTERYPPDYGSQARDYGVRVASIEQQTRFVQPIRDAIAAYDAEKGSTPA